MKSMEIGKDVDLYNIDSIWSLSMMENSGMNKMLNLRDLMI